MSFDEAPLSVAVALDAVAVDAAAVILSDGSSDSVATPASSAELSFSAVGSAVVPLPLASNTSARADSGADDLLVPSVKLILKKNEISQSVC